MSAAAVGVGLFLVLLLGAIVRPLLERLRNPAGCPPDPGFSTADPLRKVMEQASRESGAMLGFMERFFFFAAFASHAPELVAGWLAFKVASKWSVWENIVALPETIAGVDPIDYIAVRIDWASKQLMGFLVGTLANVLIAYLSVLAGFGLMKLTEP